MASLPYKTKIDLGASAACVVIGGFFAILSWQIPVKPDEITSSRAVPLFLSTMIAGLGLLIALNALFRKEGSDQGGADGSDIGFAGADLQKVFRVIGCGVVYVVLFWAVGYFFATGVTLFLGLATFDNRKWQTLCFLPIIGAIAYQVIFMGFMVLDDPVGALIDASSLTSVFSLY